MSAGVLQSLSLGIEAVRRSRLPSIPSSRSKIAEKLFFELSWAWEVVWLLSETG